MDHLAYRSWRTSAPSDNVVRAVNTATITGCDHGSFRQRLLKRVADCGRMTRKPEVILNSRPTLTLMEFRPVLPYLFPAPQK